MKFLLSYSDHEKYASKCARLAFKYDSMIRSVHSRIDPKNKVTTYSMVNISNWDMLIKRI